MEDSIKRSWEGVIRDRFFKMKGCIIERKGGGYKAFGEWYATLSEVSEEIFRRTKTIEDSIKNPT